MILLFDQIVVIYTVNFNVSRNDAGLAAAELALAVERHVLSSGSIDTVGTVGNSS